ncbi:MAG: hypothetical protein ACD_46C00534G0003 [uncultured bacterium]|nr:MAG: hypothetical protein ACD_46C00534G0003 [uncultured bacterium]
MTLKSTRLYIALFFFILTACVFILHQPSKKQIAENTLTINSFIDQATYTEYNKQGGIKNNITATSVVHYKENDTTFFTAPNILIYSDKNIPWKIQANHATMTQDNTIIVLSGNVVIHQLKTIHQPQTIIQTNTLVVYPKKSRAETNDAVIIHRRGIVINGNGLKANLKTGEYQLTSETNATLQPTVLHKLN